MACEATDDGAFDASLSLGGGWSKCDTQNGSANNQWLHSDPPGETVAATIEFAVIGSGTGVTFRRQETHAYQPAARQFQTFACETAT
jgi:hypothetical protein